MKNMKSKRIITIMLLFFMSIGLLVGCNGSKKSNFSVNVKSIHGKNLENVTVEIYSDNVLLNSKQTDENGYCSFDDKRGKYDIKLSNLPSGYYVTKDYQTNDKDENYEIVCLSKVIEETKPNTTKYVEGDLMYDFTINNTEGEALQLSQLLKTKDMVLLNFFFVSCSPCQKEFPFLDEAYVDYQESIDVLAISSIDKEETIKTFKSNNDYSLNFCHDDTTLTNYFGVNEYPTSVIIDRYGVISLIHIGSIQSKQDFTDLFDQYIGDDYLPNETVNDGNNEIEDVKPTETMPDTKLIEEAINGEGFNYSWYAEQDESLKEYTWPFLISEDGKSIYPSNSKISNSTASIYTKVHLKKDEVFTFEYLSSSELGGDYLHVKVQGVKEYSISGVFTSWQKAYAFIAETEDDYEIQLYYLKDADSYSGEDKVYIRNVQIISSDKITEQTYIKRHASYNYNSKTNRNENTVNLVYNEEDKYYHVNSVNGPLLLADIMGEETTYYDSTSIYDMIFAELFAFDNKDYSSKMKDYATWSYNNDFGMTPVTEELKNILIEFTAYYYKKANEINDDFKTYDNQWLDICCYYEGFNMNGVELNDPIKGLSTISSYKAELGDQNFVTIETFIMPRGKLSCFVPEVSGAYKIHSVSNNNTKAWIFLSDDRDNDMFFESDNGARVYNLDSDDENYDDGSNYCMYVYLEKGISYYICSGFDDMYETGTIQFCIDYLGDTAELFTSCSYGPFTYDLSGNTIIKGIDVELDDENYYREKNKDGTLGSYIYCDFTNPSYFSYSVNGFIENGYFNLAYNYDESTEITGGSDYTAIMKTYQKLIITNAGITKGCVKVDKKLAAVLQKFMDIYTFEGVNNSWLKLCYYYKQISA